MSKRMILAVDDEPLISRLVKVNLERAGYAVETALNGLEALERLRSERPHPDLILLDMVMPYMDGFEFLRQIKADPNLEHIPVVWMTVRSRDADIIQGQASGAAHYLTKPINPTDLLAVVREVFGEESPSSESKS